MIRYEVVKQGEVCFYTYEKHVRGPKRSTHLNASVGSRLVTSRKLFVWRKGGKTTAENGVVQNHSLRYLNEQSSDAELLDDEAYPRYQILSEFSKK